jgi:hypothetical protein
MNTEFLTLTKENIDKEHTCCAFSDKKCKESYEAKKKNDLKRNLKMGIFSAGLTNGQKFL